MQGNLCSGALCVIDSNAAPCKVLHKEVCDTAMSKSLTICTHDQQEHAKSVSRVINIYMLTRVPQGLLFVASLWGALKYIGQDITVPFWGPLGLLWRDCLGVRGGS